MENKEYICWSLSHIYILVGLFSFVLMGEDEESSGRPQQSQVVGLGTIN